jgi:hypothetical protein
MMPNPPDEQAVEPTASTQQTRTSNESHGSEELKLRRWQVSFSSGKEWYSVGEFVALDAKSAIDRAIDVLGSAADYLAEELPWDAAPFHEAMRAPRLRKSDHT